jgi:O-antigen biosynthesis protein
LFQSVYQPAPDVLGRLPLTPEWHLFGVALLALTALSVDWLPIALALPLLLFVFTASSVQAIAGAAEASYSTTNRPRITRLLLLGSTAFLHLLQPLARLRGRFASRPAPWRKWSSENFSPPRSRNVDLWSERWRSPEGWLGAVEAVLWKMGDAPIRGGDYDRWDLELRGGRLGAARLRMAVEEHGGGKQLVRFHAWPRYSIEGLLAVLLLVALSVGAASNHAWGDSVILSATAVVLILSVISEGACATGTLVRTLEELPDDAVVLARIPNRLER